MPQKYLKVYDEHSDYTSKFRLYTPNVSHCREEDEVHYTDGDGDMSSIPLTFEILSDGYIQWVLSNTSVGTSRTIEYKKNNDAWTSISSTSAQIPCSEGDVFQFRGDNATYGDTDGSWYNKFNVSADFNVLGNIMSLLDSQNYATLKTINSGTHTFRALFSGNVGLQNSNNLILPATTLRSSCYTNMFAGCTNLKNAPKLPATTLASFCYSSMFQNCSSLTTAPDLLAINSVQGCYIQMFQGCSSLNYIKCMLTDIGNYTVDNWVMGVAPTGTFISNPENTDWTIGISGIPTGWVTKEHYKSMPLTFRIQSDGNINWFATTSYTVTLEYSKNGGSWTEITSSTGNGTDLSVNTGDVIRFRGNSPLNDGTTWGNCNYFRNTCSYIVEGNIMSLLNKTDFNTMTDLSSYNYTFYDLFINNTSLTDASNLILPATVMSTDLTYGSMFNGCTNLTTAPELPATTLYPRCYWHMFYKCSKLNYIKCLAVDKSASNCVLDWLYNVATSGTFIKNPETTWSRGSSGIPYNWTIQDEEI